MDKIRWIALSILLIFLISCHVHKIIPLRKEPYDGLAEVKSALIMGFSPYLKEGNKAGWVRNPLTGSMVYAEPLNEMVGKQLSEKLFLLLKDEFERLVPYSQVSGICERLIAQGTLQNEREIMKKIADYLNVDAVFIGYIYLWRERKGGEYGIESPSHVSLELALFRSKDGKMIWKGSYNKRQASLSENLLDVWTFIRAGGKWVSAQRLAGIGLSKMVIDLIDKRKALSE